MKFFLVGEFYRGSLCDSYSRAFKRLGFEVLLFDELSQYSSLVALLNRPIAKYIFEPLFAAKMSSKLLDACRNFSPDVIVIFKGQHILPSMLSRIKEESKAIIININADDPLNTNRGASSWCVRDAISVYDCYFIWSKAIMPKLISSGAKRVEYLPFGFDPDICFPQQAGSCKNSNLAHDLVFVGNWDKERERWLGGITDFDLAVWGSDYWGRRCRDKSLVKHWQGCEVRNEEMSRVLGSAKISLNILRGQNKGSINMRTFEAPASKAFVMAERSAEQQDFFEGDKEAVYFSNPQELRDKIQYYLHDENKRKSIAEAGYNRAISSGYSYYDRAKQVISYL